MSHLIQKVLICNRGEVACNIARVAQRLGIEVIGLVREDDFDASHVHFIDQLEVVASYMDQESILRIAQQHQVDAIHPGYGFLSENSYFMERVTQMGCIWIGPHLKALEIFGCKEKAKACVASLGIPTLSLDLEQITAKDLPVVIKATAGGGGRCIEVVKELDALRPTIERVQFEATQTLGNDAITIEPFLSKVRHVEVQLLGDNFGHLIHLDTRDCSVQRKYQKVIEEAPALVSNPQLKNKIIEAALKIGRHLNYNSLGTIEFLVDDHQSTFWFLEGNPRLQVEYGVSEKIMGVDLIGWQFKVAAREHLTIKQTALKPQAHAIQARIYAEDPLNGYQPAFGRLHALPHSSQAHISWHWSVHANGEISVQDDPMFGKVIVVAENRNQACALLKNTLMKSSVWGVQNNISWLIALIQTESFLNNQFNTLTYAQYQPNMDRALSISLMVASILVHRHNRPSGILSGWSLRGQRWQSLYFRYAQQLHHIQCMQKSQTSWLFNEPDLNIQVVREECSHILIRIRNTIHRFQFCIHQNKILIQGVYGPITLTLHNQSEQASKSETQSPGDIVSPIPGVVIDIKHQVGDFIDVGDSVMVVEAMKMHHPIKAQRAGYLQAINVSLHDVIEANTSLASMTDLEEAIDVID